MRSAVILQTDNNVVRKISAKDYGIINIGRTNRVVKVNEVLPFRVKFMNVGLTSYGPNNPAPIGIAIVGFNNYIL
jgi:hypothetical protein